LALRKTAEYLRRLAYGTAPLATEENVLGELRGFIENPVLMLL